MHWFFLLLLLGAVMGEETAVKEVTTTRDARVKRYPKHLDPHFFPWVRVGECPISFDGGKQHFCPTPSADEGLWMCVDDYQLCDGVRNCPNAEDESGQLCLFHRVLTSKINLLTNTIAFLQSNEDADERGNKIELAEESAEVSQPIARKSHRQWGRFVPELEVV